MKSSTHALRRTSPMGELFIGTCVQCGKTGLRSSAVTEQCSNEARLTETEALLHVIDLPEKETQNGVHEYTADPYRPSRCVNCGQRREHATHVQEKPE